MLLLRTVQLCSTASIVLFPSCPSPCDKSSQLDIAGQENPLCLDSGLAPQILVPLATLTSRFAEHVFQVRLECTLEASELQLTE